MSTNSEWERYDIVLFDRTVVGGSDRTWLGYVDEPKDDGWGYMGVRWWDSEMHNWTETQKVPIRACILIGRVVDDEGRLVYR